MAAESTRSPSPATTSSDDRPRKRYARLAPLYKALIWTSFLINVVLLIIIGVLAGVVLTRQRQITTLAGNGTNFAASNLAELQDVVAKLQTSTIVYTVPLDTRLPIQIDVPINQSTEVILTQDVPLNVPANIVFAGVGNLSASSVNITLPAGLRLPIALNFSVPLNTSVPVVLDVPVNIPLAETELGPQFARLGAIVDRLVNPITPLLPWPETAPDSSRAGPPDAALPREEPTVAP